MSITGSVHNRCTSLVCSCYAPARNSDSKDDERGKRDHQNQVSSSNKDGNFQGFCSDEARAKVDKSSETNSFHRGCTGSNAPQIEPLPLKSNLKKSTMEINNQRRVGMRKVNWPDAHGKDIAHVQEFEPSVSEDGELKSVRNSCACVIQ